MQPLTAGLLIAEDMELGPRTAMTPMPLRTRRQCAHLAPPHGNPVQILTQYLSQVRSHAFPFRLERLALPGKRRLVSCPQKPGVTRRRPPQGPGTLDLSFAVRDRMLTLFWQTS